LSLPLALHEFAETKTQTQQIRVAHLLDVRMRHLTSIVCPILLMDTNLQGSLKMISRLYVLRHSMRIIYDEATKDEAAFIKCTDSQARHGVLLQLFLYSESRVETRQQFKKVTYMAHRPTPIYI